MPVEEPHIYMTLEFGRVWAACEHGKNASGISVRMCGECFMKQIRRAAEGGGKSDG